MAKDANIPRLLGCCSCYSGKHIYGEIVLVLTLFVGYNVFCLGKYAKAFDKPKHLSFLNALFVLIIKLNKLDMSTQS